MIEIHEKVPPGSRVETCWSWRADFVTAGDKSRIK